MVRAKSKIVTLYKVLSHDGYTRKKKHNAIKWTPGKWERPKPSWDRTPRLCTDAVIHAFRTKEDAERFFRCGQHSVVRPSNPQLWEARGEVAAVCGRLVEAVHGRDDTVTQPCSTFRKVGCSRLKVTKCLGSLKGWRWVRS